MIAMLRCNRSQLWRTMADPGVSTHLVESKFSAFLSAFAQRRGYPTSAVNTADKSDPSMFHRSIIGRIREGNKRATRRLRRDGVRIPGYLEGRGIIPDMLLEIPADPLFEDFRNGVFVLQRRGKTKFSGPLYELRIEAGTTDESGNVIDVSNVPFERIRVVPHNMEIHPLTENPMSVSLRYAPENEPVRVRVPIRCINEEKCKGLREGGWLNRLHRSIDINVAPHTTPPLYATLDIADMNITEKRSINDLSFQGKGNGCRPVLSDDVPAVMISPL